MIQRIFHPIGQGAFYSERFENFNVVYDCGNLHNTKVGDKVVKQSFRKDEEIDILFISHFDYDHISKIKTLKEHVKCIRKVIIPLLHENEKILLSNIYRALGYNNLTLISNPAGFFDEETSIIKVLPEGERNEQKVDVKSNEQLVPSGEEFEQGFDGFNWVYIPYNFEYQNRNKILLNALSNAGFNCDEFKNNPSYTVKQISNGKMRRKLKKIYNNLNGGINRNSMIVFSGPLDGDFPMRKLLFHKNIPFICSSDDFVNDRVACVYTGDADLINTNIKDKFKKYWDTVGTIQIPHHGDISSFNAKILADKNYFCPISVGERNSYGHPSNKVISDILSNNSYPFLITENQNTAYFEIFG